MKLHNGIYIVFEGIDGSGKGSLIEKTIDYLRTMDADVVVGKEPGGTELGVHLRQLMFFTIKTHNMAPNVVDCLMLGDHVQHMETLVKPALAAGQVVVSDRSAWSQYAYSVGRKVNDSLMQAYQDLRGPMPDRIFLLTGTPEHLLVRANKRKVETHQEGKAWNQVDHQMKIQREYLRLLAPLEQTLILDTDILNPEQLFYEYIQPEILKLIVPFVNQQTREKKLLEAVEKAA